MGKNSSKNRRSRAATTLQKVADAGHQVITMDEQSMHFRVVSALGAEVDFWPTTGTWMDMRNRAECAGKGLDSLLEKLKTYDHQPAKREAPDLSAYVTIITDASFDLTTHAAGWGAWLVTQGMTHTVSGPIGDRPKGVVQAELRAMERGLEAAVRKGWADRTKIIVLQTDCSHAIAIVLKGVPSTTYSAAPNGLIVQAARRLNADILHHDTSLSDIKDLIERNGLTVRLRHVKGHQKIMTANGRERVNHMVDRLAKNGMRQRREELTR